MPIVLLTDFGTKDAYVGMMKGVISQIAPQVQVLDLTHEVSPFDVAQAAFLLFQSYRYFPKASIFVAVVDPGVGSERKHLLVKTSDYFFLAPDNGLLSFVLEEQVPQKIICLSNEAYFLNQVSSTFHGRDVFAPVAAQLAEGIALDLFGRTIDEYKKIPGFIPELSKKKAQGKILSIDHFGNAITNFSKPWVEENLKTRKIHLSFKNKKIKDFYSHYSAAPLKKPVLLFGSSGFLEIAMNQGSAAKKLKINTGDKVSLRTI